jgi:hypothetical protein
LTTSPRQSITQIIDLAFPLLRVKEVIFDRRALLHPVSSDSHLLTTILNELPTDQRLIEVPFSGGDQAPSGHKKHLQAVDGAGRRGRPSRGLLKNRVLQFWDT